MNKSLIGVSLAAAALAVAVGPPGVPRCVWQRCRCCGAYISTANCRMRSAHLSVNHSPGATHNATGAGSFFPMGEHPMSRRICSALLTWFLLARVFARVGRSRSRRPLPTSVPIEF